METGDSCTNSGGRSKCTENTDGVPLSTRSAVFAAVGSGSAENTV